MPSSGMRDRCGSPGRPEKCSGLSFYGVPEHCHNGKAYETKCQIDYTNIRAPALVLSIAHRISIAHRTPENNTSNEQTPKSHRYFYPPNSGAGVFPRFFIFFYGDGPDTCHAEWGFFCYNFSVMRMFPVRRVPVGCISSSLLIGMENTSVSAYSRILEHGPTLMSRGGIKRYRRLS